MHFAHLPHHPIYHIHIIIKLKQPSKPNSSLPHRIQQIWQAYQSESSAGAASKRQSHTQTVRYQEIHPPMAANYHIKSPSHTSIPKHTSSNHIHQRKSLAKHIPTSLPTSRRDKKKQIHLSARIKSINQTRPQAPAHNPKSNPNTTCHSINLKSHAQHAAYAASGPIQKLPKMEQNHLILSPTMAVLLVVCPFKPSQSTSIISALLYPSPLYPLPWLSSA
jgi:hypothetical protein